MMNSAEANECNTRTAAAAAAAQTFGMSVLLIGKIRGASWLDTPDQYAALSDQLNQKGPLRLARLTAIDPDVLAAGRQAGGLPVVLPGRRRRIVLVPTTTSVFRHNRLLPIITRARSGNDDDSRRG